jgi:hypothetical protein
MVLESLVETTAGARIDRKIKKRMMDASNSYAGGGNGDWKVD